MSPGGRGPGREGAVVRVASYNLRGLRDDTEVAAAVVRAIDPDVLLVQEIPRHLGSTRATAAFAAASQLVWRRRLSPLVETALMTAPRIQVVSVGTRRLRVGVRENPRHYVVGQLRAPGGPPFTAISVHLSLREHQRRRHVGAVLASVSGSPPARSPRADSVLAAGAHATTPPVRMPLVVGGDLNEGSTGAAWGFLAQELVEVTDDRPTFPAAAPRHRIDAIFARAHHRAVPGDPAVLAGLDLAAASDHRPIWVDLTWPTVSEGLAARS